MSEERGPALGLSREWSGSQQRPVETGFWDELLGGKGAGGLSGRLCLLNLLSARACGLGSLPSLHLCCAVSSPRLREGVCPREWGPDVLGASGASRAPENSLLNLRPETLGLSGEDGMGPQHPSVHPNSTEQVRA